MKDITWPQATVVLGSVLAILSAVIVLTIYDKDASGVLTFGGLLLAGLGIGAVVSGQSAIKENVNGRYSQMLALLERQSDQLARAHPIKVVEPPAGSEEPARGDAEQVDRSGVQA